MGACGADDGGLYFLVIRQMFRKLRFQMIDDTHWRSVKYVDEFSEEGEEEGETIIRRRERFSHELTLAYEDGRIVELKETKEGGKPAERPAS